MVSECTPPLAHGGSSSVDSGISFSPLASIVIPPDRLDRYGDWDSIQGICQMGSGNGISSFRTFYNSDNITSRMDAVREAIIYIRAHWDDYAIFMRDLRPHMEEGIDDTATEDDRRKIFLVLDSIKEWADSDSLSEDFSAVRLYISNFGYKRIFGIINRAFRADDLTQNKALLQSAVFLIELLNIDLFNYRLRYPGFGGFEGTVYRGVALSQHQLNEFKELAAEPIRKRYWGIPLALLSSSRNMDVAMDFALKSAKSHQNYSPCLWRIHVFNLDPRLLQIYHDRFPSGVVSTICAVPVFELSEFPEEEVLLRGPFFQLVRAEERQLQEHEPPVFIMDAVMLNTNRDHPSTMQMEDTEGQSARKLFASLVGMGRAKLCKNLANSFNIPEDVAQYERIYREERDKVSELTGGIEWDKMGL